MTDNLPAEARKPKVKPLMWEAVNPTSLRATAIGLRYYAYANPFLPDETPWSGYSEGYLPVQLGCFATADEVKAAAQSDYEARILSAIEAPSPASVPDGQEAVANERLELVDKLTDARMVLEWSDGNGQAIPGASVVDDALAAAIAALRNMGAGR